MRHRALCMFLYVQCAIAFSTWHAGDAPTPTPSSATDTSVPAMGKSLVPTDLSVAVPEGTYTRIAPRSGLAWKHAIDVGAGVVDAGYRGPVGVTFYNYSDVDFEVKYGD